MGKALILLQSDTGHTERMAAFVEEGVGSVEGIEIRILTVEKATAKDLKWCDGIAVGCPTHLGSVSARMKQWWDEEAAPVWMEVDGKIGCAFSSSGGWAGGAELTCQNLLTILMNFGFLTFGVTDYVAPKMTAHYGAICAGEPRTAGEMEACRRLGRRLGEWIAFYVDRRDEAHPLRAKYTRHTD